MMTWVLLAGWLVSSAVIFRLVVFGDRRIHRPLTFAEVTARFSAEMHKFLLAFGVALKPATERATEAFVRFGRALGGEE